MGEEKRIRLRVLPEGEIRDGWEAGWSGALLEIVFPDQSDGSVLPAGAPVEVHSEDRVYLGMLRESRPSGVSVEVEHSLDRHRLGWIQDVWG